jgi:putative transposase
VIAEIETCRTELHIPVAVSCRALNVSVSWFYKHRDGQPSPARQRRDELDQVIEKVFVEQSGEYGSPRIHAELVDEHGYDRLSVNTVAQRMQARGLRAKRKRRGRSLTKPDPTAPKFSNLLKRNFKPAAINTSWVGDITEIETWEGKLYLATVIDLWSRRLIGFAVADNCKAPLVCDAMRMAIAIRGGRDHIAGVTFHSDRGTQYTAGIFTNLCAQNNIRQSMSRSGSCLDNAAAEAFFASFKTELIYRTVLPTMTGARSEIVAWLDRYNRTRRHSHCGLKAPLVYEKLNTPAALAA